MREPEAVVQSPSTTNRGIGGGSGPAQGATPHRLDALRAGARRPMAGDDGDSPAVLARAGGSTARSVPLTSSAATQIDVVDGAACARRRSPASAAGPSGRRPGRRAAAGRRPALGVEQRLAAWPLRCTSSKAYSAEEQRAARLAHDVRGSANESGVERIAKVGDEHADRRGVRCVRSPWSGSFHSA